MKHINIAIENMNNSTITKDEENLSIIERIMNKTGNPKIAAVLALDLFLVGVDTVSTDLHGGVYVIDIGKYFILFFSPFFIAKNFTQTHTHRLQWQPHQPFTS